jgi:hypothetical protein
LQPFEHEPCAVDPTDLAQAPANPS